MIRNLFLKKMLSEKLRTKKLIYRDLREMSILFQSTILIFGEKKSCKAKNYVFKNPQFSPRPLQQNQTDVFIRNHIIILI